MPDRVKEVLASLLLLLIACRCGAEPATPSTAVLAWPERSADSRPWTRWWWLGRAVDEDGLTRQLEALARAGFGGVEICPIYGARGFEDRYVPFLSPRWVELLRHTARETARLGLRYDLTTGTGWPFGGPNVSEADASSALVLEKQGGSWTFRSRGAVQQVKRAAPGGEGNVLDPFSPPALVRYLRRFEDALLPWREAPARAQFHDSFEYYGASFTPALFDEFAARRGYDLRDFLAALAGEGAPQLVSRVRADYRETLSDLHLAWVRRWTQWAHERSSLTRDQAHGAPANLVDVYAAADIPETELFGVPDEEKLPLLKLASSAAHVGGHALASAESFTWLGEHFQVTLAQAREAADWLFLAGVDQLVFHGVPYSPPQAPWPGWQFYASVNFGPQGGLWRDLPHLVEYLTRCQSVLQSGEPDEDVLLYFPVHDAWSAGGELVLPNPVSAGFQETAIRLSQHGYAWDAVSDAGLASAVAVDGWIRAGSGRYRAIVLPQVQRLPVETAQRLFALTREGATLVVVGPWPDDVPGLAHAEERRIRLRQALLRLRGGVRRAGQGSVHAGADVLALLEGSGARREPMADAGLRFVRRRQGRERWYFVVNRSPAPLDRWLPLGTGARSVVRLDPRSDAPGQRLPTRPAVNGDIEIRLALQPMESAVLHTFTVDLPAGPLWRTREPAGPAIPLDEGWRVVFLEGGPVLPPPFEARALACWTGWNEDARRFAGTARYATSFEAPAGRPGVEWLLDLGQVAETARVRLNGRDLGTLWCPPFRIATFPALREGTNSLQIEVTNLAANRIRDLDLRGVTWKYFHDANVLGRDYRPLDASSWPLRPSGLLGPVTLQPVRLH